MTSGRKLGIIACPILEDELVHVLTTDPELKHLTVIQNEDASNLLRKLAKADPAFTMETVAEGDLGRLSANGGYSALVWMKSMALHEDSANLRIEVQKTVKRIEACCQSILLFYGLCGNAFKHVEELNGSSLVPLSIIRDEEGQTVDDCIAVSLGGTKGYLKLLRRYPGVFYLTPSWAENWETLINKMEITRGTQPGDMSTLQMLFDMAGYKRALQIQTGLGDQEIFQRKSEEFARRFAFELLTLESEFITLDAVERSYAEAKELLNRP